MREELVSLVVGYDQNSNIYPERIELISMHLNVNSGPIGTFGYKLVKIFN